MTRAKLTLYRVSPDTHVLNGVPQTELFFRPHHDEAPLDDVNLEGAHTDIRFFSAEPAVLSEMREGESYFFDITPCEPKGRVAQ
jgi:hypothetical protein